MTQQKNNLATLRAQYADSQITYFGDGPELSDWLLSLIAAGRKTSTCSALRDYIAEGEAVPVAGQVEIVLDHNDLPVMVIRIDSVTLTPFDEVDEDFALAEGEGDYAAWRAGHIDFFGRNGGFDPKMMLVCQRFHMIADLRQAADSL